MNPNHRPHRLSLTLAGLAAAALALPACQGAATAAGHKPHHARQAIVQQTQTGLTPADLQDLAKAKRDLVQKLAERPPRP
jgi:ABC-type glycerol-3-phosphate transport system substrate-binding protein